MGQLKEGGTGYVERELGSHMFEENPKDEHRAVHGGEKPPGFSTASRKKMRHNPDKQGGPQVY